MIMCMKKESKKKLIMQEIARNDADVGGIQIEILGTYNKQSTLFRQEINSLGR